MSNRVVRFSCSSRPSSVPRARGGAVVFRAFLSLSALVVLVGACVPIRGPVEVEALVADGEGGFRLDTVTLHSVTDLERGKGELFDIRAGLNTNVMTRLAELRDENLAFEDVVARTRADDGDDMAPRLAWDGRRYVAEDFDTLQYLTLFHNFERAWTFAESIGDTSGATRTRSLVGFYGSISLDDALPVPLATADNAVYIAFLDGWMTFRIFLTQLGVPFSMNPGVVAHELHHRVFFHNVFRDDAFASWRAWVTSDEVTRAGNLLKGLDEGLADLFAVGLTRDLGFMGHSLKGAFAREAGFRDLEGELAREATYDDMRQSFLSTATHEHCGFAPEEGQDLFALADFNFYCFGTLVARTLWEGAGEDFDVLEREVLPAVNRALSRMGQRIAAESPRDALVFDLDFFLEPLVSELAAEQRARMCAVLELRFESFVTEGKVPTCSGGTP